MKFKAQLHYTPHFAKNQTVISRCIQGF